MKRKPASSNAALMRIPVPPTRTWQLSSEEVDLVKQHICKGATDAEMEFCLAVARRHKLDPIRGQIWFVPRKDNQVKRWIPIVGINGLLHVAARDHRDFGSIDEPEYGPMRKVKWTYDNKSGEINAPEWARVKAWKKGHEHPIVATVYWEEIYPHIGASPLVRQMPRHMLGKVATAHVVRKGWPGTDGLYIREEFQGPQQFTVGGRAIVRADQESEAPALDMDAPHGHQPGTPQATMAENALRRVEEADKALAEEKAKATPKSSVRQNAPTEPPIGAIELDLSVEPGYLRGDLANVLDMVRKHTKAYWDEKESWWRIPAADAKTIREMCQACGYTLNEIHPKVSGKKEKPESKRPAGGTEHPPVEPRVAKGVMERSIAGMAGKIPVRDVTLVVEGKGKPSFRCFDKALFAFLDKGVGKLSEVFVKQNGKYWNLVGLKRIGSTEFENGKVPILSVDREPGTPKLFS